MLVNTKPTADDWENNALKASNASLLGALIVHVYAGTYSTCNYLSNDLTRATLACSCPLILGCILID